MKYHGGSIASWKDQGSADAPGRADSAKTLGKIVERIDELEKTEVKSIQYTQYAELFGPWTLAALLILASEMLASCTIFRKIP